MKGWQQAKHGSVPAYWTIPRPVLPTSTCPYNQTGALSLSLCPLPLFACLASLSGRTQMLKGEYAASDESATDLHVYVPSAGREQPVDLDSLARQLARRGIAVARAVPCEEATIVCLDRSASMRMRACFCVGGGARVSARVYRTGGGFGARN